MIRKLILVATAIWLFDYVPKGMFEFLQGLELLWSPALQARLHGTHQEDLIFGAQVAEPLEVLRGLGAEDFMLSHATLGGFGQNFTIAAYPIRSRNHARYHVIPTEELAEATNRGCRTIYEKERVLLLDCGL